MNDIFMVPSLVKWYGTYDNYDYSKLNDEERMCLNFYDNCMFNSNENIKRASFMMQMLIMDYLSKLDTEDEMTDYEIGEEKYKILDGLTKDEKETIEAFGYACSKVIGIFSEERKAEKRLKKERNDNNE